MDLTVVIATFGSQEWRDLAKDRAGPSALAEHVPVNYVHGHTLHEARNAGLASVDTEHVIFLDADDELEPGYIAAMEGQADIRVPRVRYVVGTKLKRPRMPRVSGHEHHDCAPECLAEGNWLVIGCCARTALLREVSGFRDFPVYEDYDLWLRCWQAGATIERHEDAIYRAHVRPDSRNRGQLTQAEKHAVHQQIARDNAVKVPA